MITVEYVCRILALLPCAALSRSGAFVEKKRNRERHASLFRGSGDDVGMPEMNCRKKSAGGQTNIKIILQKVTVFQDFVSAF